jgi:hypothetical protein
MTILNNPGRAAKVTLLGLSLSAPIALSVTTSADDSQALTMLKGKRYEKVHVTEITPVTIAFRHSTGAARLSFTEFGADVQKKYGYDEAKALAWVAKQAKAEREQQQRQDAAEREKRARAWANYQEVEAMAAALSDAVYDGATHRCYRSQEEATFARQRVLREALQARSDAGR